MATRKFRDEMAEAMHSSAAMLSKVGGIDKATMRHFDESYLEAPKLFAPVEIKRLREDNKVSQPVFARYLNTSESTVEKWEAGTKKPSGAALKLLNVVRKHGLAVLV